jgi:hypothetical protein
MRGYLSVPLLLLLALLPLGCGKKSSPSVVPVSGRVTLDNRPLANATVRFQPASREAGDRQSPDSYGETDEQGHFTLSPVGGDEGEGAAVGKHYVQISILDRMGDGHTGPRELVPAKYNRDSKLTFSVPAGGARDSANFDLTSK